MTDIVNVYRCDKDNIGDWFSTPAFYFDEIQDVTRLDLWKTDFKKDKILLKGKYIIFGGGGLIANDDFEDNLKELFSCEARLFICWGAGHNNHGGNTIDFPSYMKKFDLAGIRDVNREGITWVPCVSCMHSAFDKKYEIKHEVVVYEHKDHPLDIIQFPKINNRATDFNEVIEFLGSADIIITSTYHGAYWGTLLNKKVIVINPFSTKFSSMKHPPLFSSISNYKKDRDKGKNYPAALDECRRANINFSKKVFDLINKSR